MSPLDQICQILSARRIAGCVCGYCRAAGKRYRKTCNVCGYTGRPAFVPCACDDIPDPCQPNTACEEHGTEVCAFCGGGAPDGNAWQILAEIRAAVGESASVGDPFGGEDEDVDAETLKRLGYVR